MMATWRGIIFLFLFPVGVLAQESKVRQKNTQFQLSDAVNDYAEVRELLAQYYRRAARKYDRAYSHYDSEKVNTIVRNISFDDGTEASTNRKAGVVGDLFETDILLTLPQAHALLDETINRSKRQANVDTEGLWEKLTIAYEFGYSNADWQNLIRASLKHVESKTCFRFRESSTDKDRLVFIRGAGCWSHVGRVGGRQQVSIGYGCDAVGIISHETLHALGLWHEQSRSDRDQFIYINFDNVYQGTQGNFERRTLQNSDNYGQPYDLGSVMHYGSKAFTTDYNKYTIETRDRLFQTTIGQRKEMTFKDAKMINLRYCTRICPTQLSCQHGGYTDPNSCYQCRCPEGYSGTYCESLQRSRTSGCGGELYAGLTYQTLTNPAIAPSQYCVWRIRSGSTVEVVVDEISFTCYDSCNSYLELKYSSNPTATGARLCCKRPTSPVVSDGPEFLVMYYTTADVDTRFSGFTLRYRATGGVDTLRPTPPAVTVATTPMRKVTTTTTTRATTTPRRWIWPPTTRSSYWSEWGQWGGCSVTCGGCGVRRRVRACYGGNRICAGDYTSEGPCPPQKPCAFYAPSLVCRGRLLLPCDLIQKLDFGSPYGSEAIVRSPRDAVDFLPHMELGGHNHELIRKFENERLHRRSIASDNDSTYYCEKRFTFGCPTSMVTIKMSWTKGVRQPVQDTRGCCAGHYKSGGMCVKN